MTTDKDFFMIEIGDDRLDYQSLFSNDNPVYIEIGCGKGEFISTYPPLNPQHNFIGFEMSGKRIVNTLKKINPAQHPNVRLARKFIDADISKFIAPASVQGIFIQHPDPWPKRKHHKRRLINQPFLNAIAEILMHDGFVQIATDHEEYANWILDEFLCNPYFSSVYDDLILETSVLDHHVVTWFEREQKRLGFAPKFMLFRRI